MSITKDFSTETNNEGIPGYSHRQVTELLAHTRALEAILRKHEWNWNCDLEDHVCLECGHKEKFAHSPDCELAKLLEG